ncbi:MAG: 30S ribosomal protein S20 [Planctomycetaceae bacterium]
MPHSASAKKRLRQNIVRRERNRATKSEIKTHVRRLLELLLAGKVPEAREQFKLVSKKADQAASSRTIHPNRAARIKSRLSSRILTASRGGAAAPAGRKATTKAKH